ncbi:MAG TPA: nucleotidyltransferase domain-containing protein, partial [Anaerolineae bacterium]|nr:nucleotidyltransferase domain-containing protein [Anaerolineae bacterium]
YGSFAKRTFNSSSDIDVFIIGNVPFKEITKVLMDAQKTLGREINPTVYPEQECIKKSFPYLLNDYISIYKQYLPPCADPTIPFATIYEDWKVQSSLNVTCQSMPQRGMSIYRAIRNPV